MAAVPVNLAYCAKISFGVGPGRRNTSNIPDSDIQCVSDDWGFECQTSTQVSEPTALKTPTVDSAECAYMTGMEPYSDMGESARYSKTSAL